MDGFDLADADRCTDEEVAVWGRRLGWFGGR
jgi:hypothetical protein